MNSREKSNYLCVFIQSTCGVLMFKNLLIFGSLLACSESHFTEKKLTHSSNQFMIPQEDSSDLTQYEESRNQEGEVIYLPGFKSKLKTELTIAEREEKSSDPLFEYSTHDDEVEVGISEPQIITGAHFTNNTEYCENASYSDEIPTAGSLPSEKGLYDFCIKLSKGDSHTIVRTPSYSIADHSSDLRADKFKLANCIDPDLAQVPVGITLTLCDGSHGEGTLVISSSPDNDTNSIPECQEDGQVHCMTTEIFKAADTSLISPSDILSGRKIGGVAGIINDCSSNYQDGCFLNPNENLDAADLSSLDESNVKNGVSIAGIVGKYPSATYPLTGAGSATDLTQATFDVRIKSGAAFEYWSEDGTRHTNTGDPDISPENIKDSVDIFGSAGTLTDASSLNPWDLRVGVVAGSLTGMLKTNCRNSVNSLQFNSDLSPPGTLGINTGTTPDWWDTIDDWNANSDSLPATLVNGWSEDTKCDAGIWKDETADGACDSGADECVFTDQISNLSWSETQATGQDWSQAVETCESLDFAGFTNWRLPTQKEAMEAYTHGIRDIGYKGGTSGVSQNNINFIPTVDNRYWTASTRSSTTSNAWRVSINSGSVGNFSKTELNYVICVR